MLLGADGKIPTSFYEQGGSSGGGSGVEFVGTYEFEQRFDTPYGIPVDTGYLYILCLVDTIGTGNAGGGGNVALVSTAGNNMKNGDYSRNHSIDFYTYEYNDQIVGATAKVAVRYENDQIRLYASGDSGSGGFECTLAVYRVQLPTA